MSHKLVAFFRARIDAEEQDAATSHAVGCLVYEPLVEADADYELDRTRETNPGFCDCKQQGRLRQVRANRALVNLLDVEGKVLAPEEYLLVGKIRAAMLYLYADHADYPSDWDAEWRV